MNAKLFAGIARGVIGLGLTGNPSELGKALGNAAVDGACERWLASDSARKLLTWSPGGSPPPASAARRTEETISATL